MYYKSLNIHLGNWRERSFTCAKAGTFIIIGMATTTCFAAATQTYKRRSRKEREEAQQKLEQHQEQKLLQKRELKAKQKRKQCEILQRNIAVQLCNRELTGRRGAMKCAKPKFSPVDSLLTLYDKKLKGNALVCIFFSGYRLYLLECSLG